MVTHRFTGATTIDEVVETDPALGRVLVARGLDTCCGGDQCLAEAAETVGIGVDDLLSELDRGSAGARSDDSAAPSKQAAQLIHPAMTVNEVIARFPGTVAVLDGLGLMSCGDRNCTLGQLPSFARAHHIDPMTLIDKLEVAAQGAVARAATPSRRSHVRPASAAPERRHLTPTWTVSFCVAGVAFALTFGATLGALMLTGRALPWAILSPPHASAAKTAHGFAQVFGFATLFIMGLGFHMVPRYASTTTALPQVIPAIFGLQIAGTVLIVCGALLPSFAAGLPAVFGPAFLLGAALLFGWVIHRTLVAGEQSREGLERYLRAGGAWLAVSASLALVSALGLTALREAAFEAALYGAFASWIFGVSLRMLPSAQVQRPPNIRGNAATFIAYQIATAAWVAAVASDAWASIPLLRAVAGTALLLATTGIILQLGVFGPGEQSRHVGVAMDNRKFILAAYAWLLAALLFGPGWSAGAGVEGHMPPAPLIDFGRHAFTLGFLTQILIGMTARVLPVFTGVPLWKPPWREAAFYLLNAAVVVRVLEVVSAFAGSDGTMRSASISGPLALGAFFIFGISTLRAGLEKPQRVVTAESVNADRLVADLLVIPGALDLLVDRGFRPLRDPAMRAAFAHTVTLRQACQGHDLDADSIVAELRALVARSPPPSPSAT